MSQSASHKTRKSHKGRRPRNAQPPRKASRVLGMESLEDRRVMTCGVDIYDNAITFVNNTLSSIHDGIGSVASGLGDIPFVGHDLQQPFNDLQHNVDDLRDAFKQFTHNGQSLEQDIKDYLFDVLGPNHLNLLGDRADDNDSVVTANDIQLAVTEPQGVCNLDVKMDLHRDLASAAFGGAFSIGIAGLPFKVSVSGGVEVAVGFDYRNLHFGYNANTGPFFDDSQQNELTLFASANFAPGTTLDADIGFLKAHIADGITTVDANGNDVLNTSLLALELPVDVNLNNGFLVPSDPLGKADIFLDVDAATTFGSNFPSVHAGFEFHDTFGGYHGQPDVLTAEFQNVTVDLGEYLTDLVAPLVDVVADVAEPIQPILDVLTARVPVLSDIPVVNTLLGDGDTDVSILDVAKFANKVGAIPEGYSELVEVVDVVSDVVALVNKIEAAGPTIKVNFGNFSLINHSGGTLKDLSPAQDVSEDTKSIVDDKLEIAGFDGSFNIDKVRDQIKDAVPDDLKGDLNPIIDKFTAKVVDKLSQGVNYTFPILDHPAESIFKLLIGKDADLFTLTGNFNLDTQNGTALPCGAIPGVGFEACFTGGVTVDALVDVGYDTYGLRRLFKTGNVADLLDGIYLSQNSHVHLTGNIGAHVGASYLVFHAGVDGGVSAALNLDLAPAEKNLDGDASKVRLASEMGDCMFSADGAIEAYLTAYAKIGVDTFFGNFDLAETHFDIAKATLFEFNTSCVANPRRAVVANLAEVNSATGELLLHMGSTGALRGVGINPDGTPVEAESFVVTPVDDSPVGPNGEQDLWVSAFGHTERYNQVKKITAHAGAGNDKVKVEAGVVVPVELYGDEGDDRFNVVSAGTVKLFGGDGDDTLLAHGTGLALLYGEAGNDELEGGNGAQNTLIGGLGNDVLRGGGVGAATVNVLGDATLELGDDTLFGGQGVNIMYGSDGNDRLVAGPLGDELDGGFGNDLLEAGAGTVSMQGSRGDDQFVWRVGNGKPQIDGGGNNDSVTLLGSDLVDTFAVSAVGNKVQYQAPAGKQFQSINVETINIFGGGSSDKITVNSLTGTSVTNVGLNLPDILNHDRAPDQITVYGRGVNDVVTVDVEKVIVSNGSSFNPTEGPPSTDLQYGGVMRVQGLPNYTVRLANIEDDFRLDMLGGDDTVNVLAITGPTLVLGGIGNDQFNVIAKKAGDPNVPPNPGANPDSQPDYLAVLSLDAGVGSNRLTIDQSASEIALNATLSQQLSTSELLPGVSFIATGGNYNNGVKLLTGALSDNVNIQGTLPGTTTIVNSDGGDDTIRVGSKAPNLDSILATIAGALSIDAGTGDNNLLLSDRTAASGNSSVLVQNNTVLGFAGPSDNVAVTYAATLGQLILNLIGSDKLDDTFVVKNPSVWTNIASGDGNDVVKIIAATKTVSVAGGEGNDYIEVGASVANMDGILAGISVVGQGGNDTLVLNDQLASVSHNYSIQGNLIQRDATSSVKFDGATESVRILAGSQDDQFHVTALPPLASVLYLDGGAQGVGLDTLYGADQTNTWSLTQQNAGVLDGVINFRLIENLVGGSQSDSFALLATGGLSGNLNGGGGLDTLDYSTRTAAATIDLGKLSATSVPHIASLESFIGSQASDTLIGTNTPNLWSISGANVGQINSIQFGMAAFAGIENLRGGTSTDQFTFLVGGSLSGAISDLGGTHDKLDYSPQTSGVTVNLAAGTASLVVGAVSGIEDVTGGSGDDLLLGNTQDNTLAGGAGNDILVGQAGNDTLQGGDQRDLLIGGDGADALQGGNDDDLLIANRTTHDTNAVALRAILAEWASGNDYITRAKHLANGGGLNQQYKLTAQTVLSDQFNDKLTGGSGQEWFWANAVDSVLDLQANEAVS